MMDNTTRAHLDNMRSTDRSLQDSAYMYLMAATEQPVPWAYAAWDSLAESLTHKDNKTRAIASQVLCNLAKSDPDQRMVGTLDALLQVTRDERFVTARHCLQALWKVGLAGPEQQTRLVNGLAARFAECISEKNGTLIRFDIIQGLRNLYDATGDESIKARALALIATEQDAKYQKKYARVWRGA